MTSPPLCFQKTLLSFRNINCSIDKDEPFWSTTFIHLARNSTRSRKISFWTYPRRVKRTCKDWRPGHRKLRWSVRGIRKNPRRLHHPMWVRFMVFIIYHHVCVVFFYISYHISGWWLSYIFITYQKVPPIGVYLSCQCAKFQNTLVVWKYDILIGGFRIMYESSMSFLLRDWAKSCQGQWKLVVVKKESCLGHEDLDKQFIGKLW